MAINFVLCNASLELFRERSSKRRSLPQSFTLLNEEDHYREVATSKPSEQDADQGLEEDDATLDSAAPAGKFRRRNWKDVRPDILHFCLLALHDSILNKEGRMCIWVHTLNSQVYRFYPEFRIPRTFKVFNKVMAKYLHTNARCLKPEGDDSTVLVERMGQRLEDLGEGGVKVAVSSRGRLQSAEDFFADTVKDDLGNLWIYISLSHYTPLQVPNESGILCVADLHKKYLDRANITPVQPTHSQDLENELLAEDATTSKPELSFDHNISISTSYPTAMSTCYKLVCAIERALDM
ncbi:nucleolar essential protein [Babesia ovata]|uniref:Nucleolar essential protein n=1 Tax=Babesia ovata TaxID=189622 RepID=A0A2H6K901_9APIC|nr:nucleolar essential protein [Babesia ovata]GBE59460.1 nucleolar essential protein [Babesia ovata]